MSILGFIKDVVLLPVDLVLDVTTITPMVRSMNDDETDSPFGTIDRLRSMVNNLDQTRNIK